MAESDGDKGGNDAARNRGGRPPKLDAQALSVVEQIAREHPRDSLGELVDRVEGATGIRVSQQTLRLRLRELGFERVVPPKVRKAEPAVPDDASGRPARYGYAAFHREQPDEAPHLHGFGDGEWEVVADLFDDKVRGVGRKYDRRLMLDAMAYVVRGGIPWRMLPSQYPPWHLVYKTFHRWSRQGRFEKMYDRLRRLWRAREGRDPEPTGAVIDSQSVKTSPQGGPKGFDGAKKVKGRKRHLLTDTLGLLLVVVLQIASIQDRDGADEVVAAGLAKVPTLKAIFTDEGYAGRAKRRLEASHPGLRVEVARHPGNRSVGARIQGQLPLPLAESFAGPKKFVPLPRRWVIERTNAWNLRPRRLVGDPDRTLESATAWVWFAEGRRLLRRLVAASPPAVEALAA